MARPTKLTPEIQERICSAIRAGNHREVSARSAGISPATFHRWMKLGEKAKGGIQREFREAVMKAEADSEVHAVAVIRKKLAEGEWRAAMQMLERRFPHRWRPQQAIEHTGTQRVIVKTEDLADPELRKELRALGRRMADAREGGPDLSGDDS